MQNGLEGTARPQHVVRARARTAMALTWAFGNAVVAGLLTAWAIVRGDGSGRLLVGVLGGCLLLGALAAVALAAVNLALARRPGRADAERASEILTVVVLLAAGAALPLGAAAGLPSGPVVAALAMLWATQFGLLLLLALGTRAAARRPRRSAGTGRAAARA